MANLLIHIFCGFINVIIGLLRRFIYVYRENISSIFVCVVHLVRTIRRARQTAISSGWIDDGRNVVITVTYDTSRISC